MTNTKIKDTDWKIITKIKKNSNIDDNLSINIDEIELTVKQQKHVFKIDNIDTYFDYVKMCAEQYKEIKTLLANGKIPKFNDTDFYDVVTKYNLIQVLCEPIKNKKSINYNISFWIKDYGNTIGLYRPINIEHIVNIINDVFKIAGYTSLLSNVNKKFMTIVPKHHKFKELKLAPNHFVLFNNGVLNAQTFEFTNDLSIFDNHQFISKIDHPLLPPSNVKQNHLQLANKLLQDWTDNDNEKITLLKQLSIATIDGNGRNNYIILLGAGGNGKSIYLNLLTNLASGYDCSLDMQDIDDDNKVNDIKNNTKLITGHELATNSKFTGRAISRIKQLATGDPFKVNVKFKDSIMIKSNCLKIQATNTTPKIFENNQAILRRIKLVQWTNKDFSKFETNLDLDEIIKDDEFIDAYLSLIFVNVKPFKKFITIKSVEEDSANAVNDADQVYQFITWMKDQELLTGLIPTNVLYQMYTYWNFKENSGSRPLKSREFTGRLKNHLTTFNLKMSDGQKTLSSLKDTDFNTSVLNEFFFDNKLELNKYNKTNYIICGDQINEGDILLMETDLALNNLEVSDFYNYKNLMILKHLMKRDIQNSKAMFELIMEDKY